MINELYLKRAIEIYTTGNNLRNDYDKIYQIFNQLIDSLNSKKEEFESILKRVDKDSKEELMSKMNDSFISLEHDIIKVTTQIDDIDEKLKKLQKDEVSLYNEIKSHYIDLSDVEIKNIIFNYIKSN